MKNVKCKMQNGQCKVIRKVQRGGKIHYAGREYYSHDLCTKVGKPVDVIEMSDDLIIIKSGNEIIDAVDVVILKSKVESLYGRSACL